MTTSDQGTGVLSVKNGIFGFIKLSFPSIFEMFINCITVVLLL